MKKPDSNQIGLAGEYYVAFILSRLGYDISVTIGRAKILDMTAIGSTGKMINIQVKSTYHGYDWLVANKFAPGTKSVAALVRLGRDATQKPELYFLPAARANELITHKYEKHSPRISRADVQKKLRDHDFGLIEQLLGK
jgi:hypothetical protein